MGFLGVAKMSKRIGVGCYGANVIIGITGGLKGLLTQTMPWIWCLAYQLELELKDALIEYAVCLQVDEMLFRIYYLHEKATKICRVK